MPARCLCACGCMPMCDPPLPLPLPPRPPTTCAWILITVGLLFAVRLTGMVQMIGRIVYHLTIATTLLRVVLPFPSRIPWEGGRCLPPVGRGSPTDPFARAQQIARSLLPGSSFSSCPPYVLAAAHMHLTVVSLSCLCHDAGRAGHSMHTYITYTSPHRKGAHVSAPQGCTLSRSQQATVLLHDSPRASVARQNRGAGAIQQSWSIKTVGL